MVSVEEIHKRFKLVTTEVAKVVIGQEDVIEQIQIAVLCNGHALLEGYPGLAKTLLVKTVSNILDLRFSRIQGTPDLLPSDITGTYIIDESGIIQRIIEKVESKRHAEQILEAMALT